MADRVKNNGTLDFKEITLIKDITTSRRMKSYLARDKEGTLYVATWPDREKLIARYELSIHHADEDMPLEEVEQEALDKYNGVAEEFRAVFERIKNLSHPNIAKVYALTHDDVRNVDIMLSEYLSGGRSIFDVTAGITPLMTIPLFIKVFEALDFQHRQNLLNLNIKTNNVWANLETSEPVVKLMNYGFAVPKSCWKGNLRGTPIYMAPEVALAKINKIDERADLYSLAVLMYYCLTRRYPFEERQSAEHNVVSLLKRIEKEDKPPSMLHFNREIPAKLDELIVKLLSKDPDERGFRSAAGVVSYFYEEWPNIGKNIPAEYTITVGGSRNDDE